MLEQGINIWGGEQFAPLFAALKRYFTELQSSLSQHYTMPTVALGAGDTISINFLSTTTSQQYMIDGLGASRPWCRLNSGLIGWNGSVFGATATLDGVTISNTDITPSLGVLHTIILTLATDAQLDLIGKASFGAGLWNGILANLKITDGTTLTHDLPFDEDFATTSIAVNKAVPLGAELVVNGDFSNGLTGWTSSNALVVDGVVTFTASGFIFQDMAGAVDTQVLTTFDDVGGSTPQIDEGLSTNSLGRFQFNGGIGDTIDNISVKQADGYATAVNITDSELFTQVGADWLGVELWVDPPPNIGSQWVDNGSKSYTYIGDGTFNQLQNNDIVVVGSTYVVSFDVASVNGTMRVASNSNIGVFSTTGLKSFTFVADGVQVYFARDIGIVNCTINNISIKRLIEVAP